MYLYFINQSTLVKQLYNVSMNYKDFVRFVDFMVSGE